MKPNYFFVLVLLATLPVVMFFAKSLHAKEPSYNYLEAFPSAEKGMKRVVLALLVKSNEDNLKIQVQIGKTQTVDVVNQQNYLGKVKTKTIEGWGYSYYQLETLGKLSTTRMANPSGKTTKRFIGIAQELIFSYQSEVPFVFYVPQEAEVRYRIWKTSNHFKPTYCR